MKNRAYHHGIRSTPYQAMFGCDVKVGLRLSVLPVEAIERIENEEDLEKIQLKNNSSERLDGSTALVVRHLFVHSLERRAVMSW
ncbi:unnamed protein product [Acanthoscelides obtectus]|uniref:Uncharacterized protein n=1 Tax=Acanthoscelides obtectus TaxID=200917 RepID=A0A9P0KFB4_ACAOB|nr:unnamed protein product [Acanthoscelides obtectus]CAK1624770.1 hypothetical protein AOBTE_LOCUS2753 [Acanthoscelides obtectus]